MPLFFLISGYFFKVNQDSKSLLHKNARQLLIPYVFTCVCVILFSSAEQLYIDRRGLGKTLLGWIYASLYGSGCTYEKPFPIYLIGAVWFLLALFFARCIFNYSSRFNGWMQFGFIAVVAYIGWKTAQFIWLPFSVQAGMVAVLFLYIGNVMHQINIFQKPAKIQYVAFASCVWLICIIFGGQLYMVKNYYGNGLFDVIGAVCATYIVLLLSKAIEKKLNIIAKILNFYGKNTLMILCFHLIDLDTFPWEVMTNSLHITGTRSGSLLVLAGRIVWVTIAVLLANKIPIIKNVFSEKQNGKLNG